ncbi:Sulfate transport system permease protein CysT [Paramagnetospirillum magnetotacticum MS-1]|uniref:Sulfate transport system permease protein CysT n=1 Tax=Paramagnetospirillum magnetotacticum MS-1 TaxID=272627 RepID=A0A0C2V2J3_PARME|nr:sulfate ABC transporter permease subunit CysT [Paramagnetospirillum magnetotacticum]KIL99296.1 Sulfate transport system permease protein CysT [Paramagnetospirillum magnetotacticum MS-1]
MRARRLLPGFSLTMGVTLAYLGLVVLLPLGAMLIKAAGMSLDGFIAATTGPRALAAYEVTLVSAAEAVVFNGLAGLLFAWVLARYQFFGRNLLDALIDLPFAMPTAVAGLALAAAFAPNGWVGQYLEPLGVKVVHAQPGIAIAMAFTSLPFVVRSVQPVIEELETETEEAARTLGASEMQIFLKVILPTLAPSLLAGMSLAFARCLGEFGAIIFIAGNRPFETEIAALLIFIKLEEYEFGSATAIATVVLAFAFATMLLTNGIQAWQQRYLAKG